MRRLKAKFELVSTNSIERQSGFARRRIMTMPIIIRFQWSLIESRFAERLGRRTIVLGAKYDSVVRAGVRALAYLSRCTLRNICGGTFFIKKEKKMIERSPLVCYNFCIQKYRCEHAHTASSTFLCTFSHSFILAHVCRY